MRNARFTIICLRRPPLAEKLELKEFFSKYGSLAPDGLRFPAERGDPRMFVDYVSLNAARNAFKALHKKVDPAFPTHKFLLEWSQATKKLVGDLAAKVKQQKEEKRLQEMQCQRDRVEEAELFGEDADEEVAPSSESVSAVAGSVQALLLSTDPATKSDTTKRTRIVKLSQLLSSLCTNFDLEADDDNICSKIRNAFFDDLIVTSGEDIALFDGLSLPVVLAAVRP